MSIEIMSKIWNISLSTHSMKLVAIAIADNANDQGHCWPGMKTLARKCDLTENGVRQQIIKLESMGLLKVDIRGGRESNRYQFDLDKLNSLPPNAVAPSPKPRLGHPQTPFTPPPNAVAPNRNRTVSEPSLNPNDASLTLFPQKPSLKDKKKYDYEIPKSLNDPRFTTMWNAWLSDRKERKKPVTKRGAEIQLRKLSEMGPERAASAIENSIEKGYQGIFEQVKGKYKTNNDDEARDDVPF